MVPGVFGMVLGIYGTFWKDLKGSKYNGRFQKCTRWHELSKEVWKIP
jgi:hypothetical protein